MLIQMFTTSILLSALKTVPAFYMTERECRQAWQYINSDRSLGTTHDYINYWSNYKLQCKRNGIYQECLNEFYIDMDMFEEAINLCLQEINNPDVTYDTKWLKYAFGRLCAFSDNNFIHINLAMDLCEKYPTWHAGYHLYGLYYDSIEKYDLALKFYKKSLRLTDNVLYEAVLHLMISNTEYMLGNNSSAIFHFYKAREKNYYRAATEKRTCATVIKILVSEGRYDEADSILHSQERFDSRLDECDLYAESKKLLEKSTSEKNT